MFVDWNLLGTWRLLAVFSISRARFASSRAVVHRTWLASGTQRSHKPPDCNHKAFTNVAFDSLCWRAVPKPLLIIWKWRPRSATLLIGVWVLFHLSRRALDIKSGSLKVAFRWRVAFTCVLWPGMKTPWLAQGLVNAETQTFISELLNVFCGRAVSVLREPLAALNRVGVVLIVQTSLSRWSL